MHSLSGSSATVCGYHSSISVFIKFNTQFVQPFDRIRCFHYQSLYQFRFCCEMSAAEAVQIMLYRRVIFFICCLDSAFSHHGVGITDTQFGNDHNICACVMCFDGTGRTCSTATDNEYIHIIIYFFDIYFISHQTACGMKHICQLQRSFLTFVRPYFDLSKRIWVVIWMEFFQKSVFFVCCQTSRLCCHTLCSCSLYLFDRLHHIFRIWCIHVLRPPISQSLCCCKVLPSL